MNHKEAEGDGKSESKKMREQKRLDMISMECLLTVLRGPGPWDKWLNTAPVKARGFLWACVSPCVFCWREGSSQLIDTELSMKRTKRSPLLPLLASPPNQQLPASLRLHMKHTRAHKHTYACNKMKSEAWIHRSVNTNAKKRKKMKINIWTDGPLFNFTRSVIHYFNNHG